jgi:cystathionine gamma-synthase
MQHRSQTDTIAVHAGRKADPATGAVTPSPVFSTTFERSPDGTMPRGFVYSRTESPSRGALEEALAALEGGEEAVAFASGQAATAAILHALAPGARVVFPDDIYHGTRALVKTEFARWGVTAEFADFTDLPAVERAIGNSAQLVWIETPSNPRLRISDIAAVAKLGRAAGALVAADNTWATPVLSRPLSLGVDVVMHSTTKYIGGHSDVLGGALVLGSSCPTEIRTRVRSWQKLGGATPAPFDCWLLLRSLTTMPVRVRAQSQTAEQLAAWLSTHPRVERVNYPGLTSHPGYAIAASQMRMPGAMLSFEVRGGCEQARDVAAKVKLITRATSLGGVESLIEHRKLVEGPDSNTPDNLLRFSVGLEHVEDLKGDLQQALG